MFSKPVYTLRPQEVFTELETTPHGLSSGDAIERKSICGKNRLRVEEGPPLWKLFFTQVTHPFALLLWIAGGMALLN
ncbi:MAG: cation-transporting P-type ATPase, partial [Anaerolineaceae bacterium]